ncbi:MAG: hypothetical protein JOZ94_30095 [Xanthobacteraceae bacterium]|nr:hypothetical protein [Xanthobacteraceae bacterium]MBV9240110.1 hypothetical protein [Xanthobacteraceae bacterium]MBV9632285.1 hypothetical protein [Xanthobacteraceae bacterium]
MHVVDKDHLHRAERASETLLNVLIWGGLALCVVVATLFDLGLVHF